MTTPSGSAVPAPSARRGSLNLLTYALAVNALALHRHRRTSSDPPLPIAA